MIQNLKREYQEVSTEKIRLKDFFKKQEEEKQKAEEESLLKKHAKQLDLYSKMLAMKNRRQKKNKNYESGTSYYEGSVENDVYEKGKKIPTGNYLSEESKID